MTDKFVGLEAAPSDDELVAWLRHKKAMSGLAVVQYVQEFEGVYNMTVGNDEPKEFAFARLLNNLATLESSDVLHMLAAMIWDEVNVT